MSVPQMPQWEIFMSMSVGRKGLGAKDSQERFPLAEEESWPIQPLKVEGDMENVIVWSLEICIES